MIRADRNGRSDEARTLVGHVPLLAQRSGVECAKRNPHRLMNPQ
jgi:hypothetical protein